MDLRTLIEEYECVNKSLWMCTSLTVETDRNLALLVAQSEVLLTLFFFVLLLIVLFEPHEKQFKIVAS